MSLYLLAARRLQGVKTGGKFRSQYVTICSTGARGKYQRRSKAPGLQEEEEGKEDKRRSSRLEEGRNIPLFVTSDHHFSKASLNLKQTHLDTMAALSLRLPSLEDGDPWIVHQKLFDVLNEYLQPSSSTGSPSAAKVIDSLTPNKRQGLDPSDDAKPKEECESFLLETWGTFIEIARQIPSEHASQDRLVDLVKALSELPSTSAEIWGSTMQVWTDLPLLGPSMREAWIPPTGAHGKSLSPNDAQRWINQNAFAARLLNLEKVSWSNFAVWSLRAALEEKPSTSAESYNCDVAAAAQWILHSGSYLLKEVKSDADKEIQEQEEDEGEAKPNRGQPLAAGSLYKGKGKARLCPERWQFWKQQFGEITQQGAEENVKSIAQQAKEKMDSV
ncbi:hypothetical protein FQN49_001566 [Arthroderma sp. PD_2]|nr:hypothetical protein FQN49_001566 [Arthroderma sp. PD_2]